MWWYAKILTSVLYKMSVLKQNIHCILVRGEPVKAGFPKYNTIQFKSKDRVPVTFIQNLTKKLEPKIR